MCIVCIGGRVFIVCIVCKVHIMHSVYSICIVYMCV